eukprot:1953841-Pyramimonas_sp.AAC.1
MLAQPSWIKDWTSCEGTCKYEALLVVDGAPVSFRDRASCLAPESAYGVDQGVVGPVPAVLALCCFVLLVGQR